jgi:hypothetical protein
MIPTVPLKYCEFDKKRKVLKLASEFVGMPTRLNIWSHHTGTELQFFAVGPEDVLFDPDQWDGEMQVYRPVYNMPNVDHLVIYHAY